MTRKWLCSLLALVCLGCGLEQDVSLDAPEAAPPEGPSVSVSWDGIEAEVFLDDLDKVLVEEALVCLLWDVLVAAGLEEEEIRSMRFDFESADGFRPSRKGCDPLEDESLMLGYLDPEDMNLIWDSSLGLPGCYRVTQVARILGESA